MCESQLNSWLRNFLRFQRGHWKGLATQREWFMLSFTNENVYFNYPKGKH